MSNPVSALERIQAAWNAVPTLPPLDFYQDEAESLLASLTSAQDDDALYSQWLASGGCDDAPTLTPELHRRFQDRLDLETRARSTPSPVSRDKVAEAEAEALANVCQRARHSSASALDRDNALHDAAKMLRALALAQPAAGVEGWKLVPVEPTEAMLDAGRPDSPPQIMRATAAQAIAMYDLGLQVARSLTPLGLAVRHHLKGASDGE